MSTKHIALLAASTLMFSACQTLSDGADVATASAPATLSEIAHVPMGQAKIREERGQLFATNMRTIADGVRSMFQPGVRWEAELAWASGTTAIRMNAINSRLSGEDITSSLALDRVGTNEWKLGADFVSPSHRVNVYNGDQLVGTLQPDEAHPVSLKTTVLVIRARFIVIIIIITNATSASTTAQQCAWEIESPEGVEVVQGSTVLRGNRVQVIEDAHEPYGGVDEVQVLGNGNVTYRSEAAIPE